MHHENLKYSAFLCPKEKEGKTKIYLDFSGEESDVYSFLQRYSLVGMKSDVVSCCYHPVMLTARRQSCSTVHSFLRDRVGLQMNESSANCFALRPVFGSMVLRTDSIIHELDVSFYE